MKIQRVDINELNQGIVVLLDQKERYCLSITMELSTAHSIAAAEYKYQIQPLLAHDIICTLIRICGNPREVLLDKVQDHQIFATLIVETSKKKEISIDFNSADAIAVAVRLKIPIYADYSVIDKVGFYWDKKSLDWIPLGSTVLEHVFDPIGLLDEIRRVLKPNGNLFLSVPNDFNLFERMSVFLTGNSKQTRLYKTRRQYKHHTLFTYKLLKFMLDETCFKITEFKTVYKIPFLHKFLSIRRKRVTQNRLLGKWFGRTFVIKTIII